MPTSKFLPLIPSILGVSLAVLLLQGHDFYDRSAPAYALRGDEVEQRFADYSSRLAHYRKQLTEALASSAPKLLVHLEISDPITPGYQILPRIILGLESEEDPRKGAVAYSWPWTTRLIDREAQALRRDQAELEGIDSMAGVRRKALLERLALNYRQRGVQYSNIASHIGYNRFWQAAIAADRSVYDRHTALQRLVIEHQKIDARLQRARATFVQARDSFRDGEPIQISEIERDLARRRALLAGRIEEITGVLQSPAFVRMEKSAAGWVFRVPLFTDIGDRKFVEEIKRIIESTWQLTARETAYQVALDVTFLSVDLLYGSAKPKIGDRLDIVRHLTKFPAGGAILTSGGVTTHTRDHAIVLGPHPVAPRIIAHEFGHVLGFSDRYVRGYRNLGRDGFQVVEVIADSSDIMSATARGNVRERHFSRLAEHYRETDRPIRPAKPDGPQKARLTES